MFNLSKLWGSLQYLGMTAAMTQAPVPTASLIILFTKSFILNELFVANNNLLTVINVYAFREIIQHCSCRLYLSSA